MTALYLSGPMRHKPMFNFDQFAAATIELRADGFEVFSPAERDTQTGFDPTGMDGTEDLVALGFNLREALGADMEFITQKAYGVAVLDGWEQSSGARAEVATALALGLPVAPVSAWLDCCTIDPIDEPCMSGPCASWKSWKAGLITFIPGPRILTIPAMTDVEIAALKDRWQESRRTRTPIWPDDPGETRIVDPTTGGEKGQKLAQIGAVDPAAILAIGEVAGFGASKYERYNFAKGYAWSLSFDAMMRHLFAFWGGQDNDPESGLPHVAHAGWHCLTLLTFSQRGRGTDDRFPVDQDVAA